MITTRRQLFALGGLVLGAAAYTKLEGITRYAEKAVDFLFDNSPGKRTTIKKELLDIVREHAHVQERSPGKGKPTALYFGCYHTGPGQYTEQAVNSQLEIFRVIELLTNNNLLSAVYVELPEGKRHNELAPLEYLRAENNPGDERLKKIMRRHNLQNFHLLQLRTFFDEQYGFLTNAAKETADRAPLEKTDALAEKLTKGKNDGQITWTKAEIDDAYNTCKNHIACVEAYTEDSIFNVEKLSRGVAGNIAIIAGSAHAEQVRKMGQTELAPLLQRYNLVHVTTPSTSRPDTASHYLKLYYFEELKKQMEEGKIDTITTKSIPDEIIIVK